MIEHIEIEKHAYTLEKHSFYTHKDDRLWLNDFNEFKCDTWQMG